VEGDDVVIRLDGAWTRRLCDERSNKLAPQRVSRRLTKRGVMPPQLSQLVEE